MKIEILSLVAFATVALAQNSFPATTTSAMTAAPSATSPAEQVCEYEEDDYEDECEDDYTSAWVGWSSTVSAPYHTGTGGTTRLPTATSPPVTTTSAPVMPTFTGAAEKNVLAGGLLAIPALAALLL